MSSDGGMEKQEHGPEVVCYSYGAAGYRPYIQCLCGWHTLTDGLDPVSWAEAGEEYDEHLEEAHAIGG